MKITTDLGTFRKTEEYDYKPTVAELHYWYSGTNSGFTRDNPYYHKHGVEVTKVRLTQVSGKVVKSQEATNGTR